MLRRIALVVFLAACGPGAATGQKPAGIGKDAPLIYRVIPVPEWVFSDVDPSNERGLRKPKPGVRPFEIARPAPVPPGVHLVLKPNTEEYDITEFLKPYGFSFPPGSLSVYDGECGVLVLRNTAANLDRISRIFPDANSEINHDSRFIELSAYECTFAQADGLLPWAKLTFSDLQNLPRGSLKLIDRTSLVADEGRLATNSHVTNPGVPGDPPIDPKKGAGGFTFQPGETGAIMEVVPLGDQLQISYRLHARLKEGSDEISEVNFTTSVELWDDYPAIIHVATVKDQPGKYIVIVARMNDGDGLDRWKLPLPKPGPQPVSTSKASTGPAKNPLPPGMILTVFRLPPGFFAQGPSLLPGPPAEAAVAPTPQPSGTPKPTNLPMEFLKANGVGFPPGSAAFYDRQASELTVINTPEYTDLVDMIVSSGLGRGESDLVLVELSAYEFTFPATRIIRNLETFTFSDLEKLPRDSVEPLGGLSLVTRSGDHALAGDATSAAPSDESSQKAPVDSWRLQPGETGMEMNVRPELGNDGHTIDLDIHCLLRMAAAKSGDALSEVKIAATARAADNTPMVIRVVPLENQEGKYVALVARAKWVNYGGWGAAASK